MPRVAPAPRIRLVDAISNLQKLRREMARLSQTDEEFDSQRRLVQLVIQELRGPRTARFKQSRRIEGGTRR